MKSVKELITLLKKCNPDQEVCFCVKGVSVEIDHVLVDVEENHVDLFPTIIAKD